MIKAVIFDMDGLLIDSEPLWRRAQRAAFKTVGFELKLEEMHHLMGRGVDSVVDKLGIRQFFDQIYSAEHEPYSKPHPGASSSPRPKS